MIRNHLKIAWRSILKNKCIFGLNILGLVVGIASCLAILLFVKDELSYDTFNKKADQIVRVVFNAKINGEVMKEAVVMAPVAKAFKDEFPEVLDATRMTNLFNPKIVYKNTSYRDSRFAYVDPNFFQVFTLPIIKGNSKDPLARPNTVVITSAEAKKYFGNENPIGKILILENYDRQFTVTAVMKEVPKNSHFHFDLFASTEGYEAAQGTSWVNSDFFTYLVLKKGTDIKKLETKIPAIIDKYMGPQIKGDIGIPYSEFKKDNQISLNLQPLTDIHLRSDFSASSQLEQGGDIKYLYIFSAIALFMLLIACINFMNLATAAASKRAKEVGIRKILGAAKKQLISQFLMESVISVSIAMGLALVIFVVALPVFNQISGKELQLSYLMQPSIILALLGLMLFIIFSAGVYPAFFLSSFKPISALQNRFSGMGQNKNLRGGLVVFQFVVSAGLILATIVVSQQMRFIQNKNLGYDKDQLLVLRESYLLGQNEIAFKNEILKVSHVSQSGFVPAGESDTNMFGIFLDDQYQRRMFVYNVDEEYIPTMGMELAEGRNFSKEFGADSTKVIINQIAAEILGFGKNALGKTLSRDTDNGKQQMTVIGVVRDFHFRSLRQKIEPLIMLYNPYGGLILRTKTADMSGLIASLETQWKQFGTKEAFTYSILDDDYNHTYLAERKMGTILRLFALLTILVACLGLFGLVTYTAEQRVKEIGIRKVLGSSVGQIVGLLSKDFLKLVGISFLIAFPLGFYLMNRWLRDFAYRIEIRWWMFVLAAGITLFIAFVTISFKSVRAAMANPVESLKAAP